MRDSANFIGFSFSPDSAWTIVQGQTFPLLRGMPGGTAPQIAAQAASLAAAGISRRPAHVLGATLHSVGRTVDLELSGSSQIRVTDAVGHQVLPLTEFAPGIHALDLPHGRGMLFVQIRAGASTTTLPLLPVR
jgi:hypothetical protein